MNKELKSEIWEIQAILYLVLAQMVETDWIMWALRICAFIRFIGAARLLYKAKVEQAKK